MEASSSSNSSRLDLSVFVKNDQTTPQIIQNPLTPEFPLATDVDPHSTQWSDVNVWRFAALMSVFSTAENAIFYPFYVLKTREQADRSQKYKPLQSLTYHLSHIYKTDGIRNGLYRGFWVSSLTSLPSYGVYMGVYTWSKDQLLAVGESSSNKTINSTAKLYAPFLAGLLADLASIPLYVPGDVIVQRLQMMNSPYKSFTHACRSIYLQEGIRGFFVGAGATLLTSGIASALWWMIYENSKKALYSTISEESKQREIEAVKAGGWAEVNRFPQVCAGFIAGTVTSALVNPLDVVKTRMQVHSKNNANSTRAYSSVIDGLRQVYLTEGFKGYFRGVVPKLISRGPLSAASSLLYELVLFLSRKD